MITTAGRKVERFDIIHHGKIICEDDGTCREGYISLFGWRGKKKSVFMPDWKPLLNFLYEIKKMHSWFMVLMVRNNWIREKRNFGNSRVRNNIVILFVFAVK